MSRSILWRTAAVQTVLVGVLSAALALALGDAFFKHWGWIVGPIAWLACSYATALILTLPRQRTMIGSLLAGIPSVILVIAGLHTIGDIAAIATFALWCAFSARVAHAQLHGTA